MATLYKTARWEKLRERALRRDEYRCRECGRYGRTTAATTVHHIYPVEGYPQWRWAKWNCLSLCTGCHERMHDREAGKLTALGLGWQDRVPPL